MALKIYDKETLVQGKAEGTIDGHRPFEVDHVNDKLVMTIKNNEKTIFRHQVEITAREVSRAAVSNFIYAALAMFRRYERGIA